MNRTILFDLDDTLLKNDMEKFLPAYLNLLAKFLVKFCPVDKLPSLILQGTEKMIRNENPSLTLEECFDSFFYIELQQDKTLLSEAISDFYNNIFPQLQYLTAPIPDAKQTIEQLVSENVNLVIATNPLFPKKAILHRLHWANLIPENMSLITSYETSHFCKPNPAYLAETLANMGWPDGLLAVVGNDWEQDILPAELLGVPTFFLGNDNNQQKTIRHPFSANGNFSQVGLWIKEISKKDYSFECNAHPDAYMAILISTAAWLDTLKRNLEENALWSTRPSPEEWSLVEIIAHMADVDQEVNILRIKAILKENYIFLPAAMTDEWTETRNYIQRNVFNEIDKFIENRKNFIEILKQLTPEKWQKKANHAIFGPTSILELVRFIVQHDRLHIQQIYNTKNLLKL
ncbi:MAG: hypothetical protein CVU39_05420 [Chloroflexi bacterium HGW-Chloroflexi-10]|nr:MAG: hypothetical protein CVU39_05420 [Chloroflexi bacterium HGW-Chloroflexi-10]